MYLKRLTMKGFKSFADATSLELEPGVTVVVGPNGSGKSNVVDAVTWVLGAQGPRALRSAKMEDVIFAGTASRPALGRAEVSLTIDNADGRLPVDMAEVTISRTLFRSGDSEYAINGTPCRLLDIQELLSDSGVGRQQHMIIGQGQLDTVLNARPEDRRAVIEEAAGVLKHRRRKERAERRLAATQENLERLGDLVREVRRQMRPLERQAAAARSYTTLFEERHQLLLHLAGHELSTLRARSDEIAVALRQGQITERELRQSLAELDAAASATAASLSQDNAEDLARSVAQVQGLVERARGLGAVLHQRARGVAQALEAAADVDVVASLEADGARVASEIATVDEEFEALGPERGALKDAEVALARAEEEYEATWGGGNDDDAMEELARATERVELLERAARVRQGLVDDLSARQEKAQARRDELEQRRATAQAEAQQTAPALADAQRVLDDATQASRTAAARAEQADEAAQREEEAAARATARAEALSRALDELTGRSGRQALAQVDGVVGSLVDLMVVDPGWERAVESAAGAAVAAVVVDGQVAARHALERLRREGASGLVLAATDEPVAALDDLPAGATRVRDHVELREGSPVGLRHVLDRLFGRSVRVESLERAIEIALERPELIVVTEQGDRFAPSGWRVSAGAGVVTAAAVEEAMRAAGTAAERAQQAAEERRARRAAATEAQDLHAEAQRSLDKVVSNQEALAVRIATTAEALASAAEELEEIGTALDAAHASLADERSALGALRDSLPALEEAARSAEERSSWAQEARATLDAHRAQVLSLRQSLEVRAAELTERRRTLTERLEQIERRLAGHVEARSQAEARRLRLEAEARAIERLGEVTDAAHSRLEALLAARRESYEAEVLAVRASNDKLEQLRRDRTAAEAALSSYLAQSRELDIEGAEVAVRLEAVIETIRRDLDADPGTAIETPCPELPEGVTAEERAASLGAELDALGPINPLALEELSALEERHQDLDTQVADVRDARRELQEVVRTLDEEIMSTFATAAADVNEHFSNLVAMLFPGGQGRLVLTEPDDLLATGVEIEVRPLGRNVRRVSLLSGGERSMAALAFLFAVFRSRPSPFYLMDEVEAALDDVNLHRFLGLIKEFRDEAQLIVVSHQKRTMETGDALYGVTMAPGGSSQVVSQRVPARTEPEDISPAPRLAGDGEEVNA